MIYFLVNWLYFSLSFRSVFLTLIPAIFSVSSLLPTNNRFSFLKFTNRLSKKIFPWVLFTDAFRFYVCFFICSLFKESTIIILVSSILFISILYTSIISDNGKYITSFSLIACADIFLVAPFNVNLFDSNLCLQFYLHML